MADPACARHIGVQSSRLLRDRRGIGRTVRNVLLWIPRHRPDVRFTLFVRRARETERLRAHLAEIEPSLPDRTTIEPLSALPSTPADVVWYPWNRIDVASRRAPMVVTVNDIAPMLRFDNRWWNAFKRLQYRQRYLRTLRLSELVIAISRFTALELRRVLNADPERIRVTLLATDDMTPSAGERSATLARLGVNAPFFLTVGAQDARKNLATLYRAMERLHAAGERVPLVQCGPSFARGRPPFVRHAGFVDDAELATLYRLATALVFPSRYEGFGLPVLEAMSAGGRVVCADSSSLPEVVGPAALLFPWDDADALAERLSRVLHDGELRERLTLEGRDRAARFRWEETTRQILAVFDEAVDRRLRAAALATVAT